MPGILDALRGQIAKRHLASGDQIVDAARRVAADESVDPVALETAMFASGTTIEQFEQLVELCRKRQRWLADFDELKGANSRLAKAEAALKAETTRFEEARRIAFEKINKLERQTAEARAAADRGQTAKDSLLDPRNVPGPVGEQYLAMLQERDNAQSAVNRIEREIKHERDRAKIAQQQIKRLEDESARTIRPDRVVYRNEVAAWTDQAAESLSIQQEILDRATKQIARLEKELTVAQSSLAAAERDITAMAANVLKS